MSQQYLSRADIGRMLSLKSSAVLTLCARPDFPEPIVINSRVYRYPADEVHAYLERLRGNYEDHPPQPESPTES